MSFKMVQAKSYKWPVAVEIPIDGGQRLKNTFDLEFKRFTESEVREIRASVMAIDFDAVAIAGSLFIGWAGIQDDDKNEIPYSETSKAQLLQVATLPTAVIKAFFDSVQGAERKN